MIFDSDLGPMWTLCAQRLGLELRPSFGATGIVDNFGYMLRTLGPPQPGAMSHHHWMAGSYAGVPVVGRTWTEQRGKSTLRLTCFAARIDPPLFLGLRVRSLGTLEALFTGLDVKIGYPQFDEAYQIWGFNGQRVAELFWSKSARWETTAALMRLRLVSDVVSITDNMVTVTALTSVTEIDKLTAWLRDLTFVARQLAAKRRAMRAVDGELPDGVWEKFAEQRRLAFDRERMKVTGTFNGCNVELRLYTQDGVGYTEARAYLPVSLGVGLRVFRERPKTGLLSFLDATPDITIGDAEFDDAFVVQAFDALHGRTALANPEVRAHMLEVLHRTGELSAADTMVWTRMLGGVREPAHLDWLLSEVSTIASLLAGQSVAAGATPYR